MSEFEVIRVSPEHLARINAKEEPTSELVALGKWHRDNCRAGRGRAPMKNRVIRVDDPTWEAAMRAAEAKDERLSAEIRKWLERYGKDHRDQEGK